MSGWSQLRSCRRSAALSRCCPRPFRSSTLFCRTATCQRLLCTTSPRNKSDDPRLEELGEEIVDKYATLRSNYSTPKHPIVLAHGLLGFSELHFGPAGFLPAIQYWHGIQDALTKSGAQVYAASVPPSSAIEERAAKLSSDIRAMLQGPRAGHSPGSGERNSSDEHCGLEKSGNPPGKAVNIVAHSMGGLDARYMASHLVPPGVKIASVTTIATPHRGSSFASSLLTPPSSSSSSSSSADSSNATGAAPLYLPHLYRLIRRTGLSTAAFSQLTTSHMAQVFNPSTPDAQGTRYFSFGAATDQPSALSPFRMSWNIINREEGANDGLVSVKSSQWGEYRGTLVGVSHLDLINWSNRVRWTVREWMGIKRSFNAIALYLDIADMLAKEGL